MSKVGQYYPSNYQSTGVRSFGKTARIEIRKAKERKALQTPGPGKYQIPSDFGSFNSKKFTVNLRNKCFSA